MSSLLGQQLAKRRSDAALSVKERAKTRLVPGLEDLDVNALEDVAQQAVDRLGLPHHVMDAAFSPSKDRLHMTKEEVNALSAQLEAMVRAIAEKFSSGDALALIDLLNLKFRLFDFHSECVILNLLPFHETNNFVRVIQAVRINERFAFLQKYAGHASPVPLADIVKVCKSDPKLIDLLATNGFRSNAPVPLTRFACIVLVQVMQNAKQDLEQEIINLLINKCLPIMKKTTSNEIIGAGLILLSNMGSRVALQAESAIACVNVVFRLAAKLPNLRDSCILCIAALLRQSSLEELPQYALTWCMRVDDLGQSITELSRKSDLSECFVCIIRSIISAAAKEDEADKASRRAETLHSLLQTGPVKNNLQSLLITIAGSNLNSETKESLLVGLRDQDAGAFFAAADQVVKSRPSAHVKEALLSIVNADGGAVKGGSGAPAMSLWAALHHPEQSIRMQAMSSLRKHLQNHQDELLEESKIQGHSLKDFGLVFKRFLEEEDSSMVKSVLKTPKLLTIIPPTTLQQTLCKRISVKSSKQFISVFIKSLSGKETKSLRLAVSLCMIAGVVNGVKPKVAISAGKKVCEIFECKKLKALHCLSSSIQSMAGASDSETKKLAVISAACSMLDSLLQTNPIAKDCLAEAISSLVQFVNDGLPLQLVTCMLSVFAPVAVSSIPSAPLLYMNVSQALHSSSGTTLPLANKLRGLFKSQGSAEWFHQFMLSCAYKPSPPVELPAAVGFMSSIASSNTAANDTIHGLLAAKPAFLPPALSAAIASGLKMISILKPYLQHPNAAYRVRALLILNCSIKASPLESADAGALLQYVVQLSCHKQSSEMAKQFILSCTKSQPKDFEAVASVLDKSVCSSKTLPAPAADGISAALLDSLNPIAEEAVRAYLSCLGAAQVIQMASSCLSDGLVDGTRLQILLCAIGSNLAGKISSSLVSSTIELLGKIESLGLLSRPCAVSVLEEISTWDFITQLPRESLLSFASYALQSFTTTPSLLQHVRRLFATLKVNADEIFGMVSFKLGMVPSSSKRKGAKAAAAKAAETVQLNFTLLSAVFELCAPGQDGGLLLPAGMESLSAQALSHFLIAHKENSNGEESIQVDDESISSTPMFSICVTLDSVVSASSFTVHFDANLCKAIIDVAVEPTISENGLLQALRALTLIPSEIIHPISQQFLGVFTKVMSTNRARSSTRVSEASCQLLPRLLDCGQSMVDVCHSISSLLPSASAYVRPHLLASASTALADENAAALLCLFTLLLPVESSAMNPLSVYDCCLDFMARLSLVEQAVASEKLLLFVLVARGRGQGDDSVKSIQLPQWSPKEILSIESGSVKFLADLLLGQRFQNSIYRSSSAEEAEIQPRLLSMCKSGVLLLRVAGVAVRKASMDPHAKQSVLKAAKARQSRCETLIEAIQQWLSADGFVSTISVLMQHEDFGVRRRAVQHVAARLVPSRMRRASPDDKKLLLQLVDDCEKTLSSVNEETAKQRKNVLALQYSLLCLDNLATSLAADFPTSFVPLVQTITSLFKIKNWRVRACAMSSLASLCTGLKIAILPFLPSVTQLTADALAMLEKLNDSDSNSDSDSDSDDDEFEDAGISASSANDAELYKESLLSLVLSQFVNIPEFVGSKIGSVLESMMVPTVMAQKSKSVESLFKQLLLVVVQKCEPRHIVSAMPGLWDSVKNRGRACVEAFCLLINSALATWDKPTVDAATPELTDALCEGLELRSQSDDILDAEIVSQDDAVVSTLISLIMKLSEKKFKPIFQRIVDRAVYSCPISIDNDKASPKDIEHAKQSMQRAGLLAIYGRHLSFFNLCRGLAEKLKSIFSPYCVKFLDRSVTLLLRPERFLLGIDRESAGNTAGNKRARPVSSTAPVLKAIRESVMQALAQGLKHDLKHKVANKERTDALTDAILQQLQDVNQGADEYRDRVENSVAPLVASTAISSGTDALWRRLSTGMLTLTREDSPMIRFGALLCVQSMIGVLGEAYLALLPEAAPFLHELQEDDDEGVEALNAQVVKSVEAMLGESLNEYLN